MKYGIFAYAIASYVVFVATFLYAIGFVGNIWVPKSMDVGEQLPVWQALLINLVLLGVFAVQHSVMPRKTFKKWWVTIIDPAAERSTYVLLSSLALAFLFWQWKPMGQVIWDLSGTTFGSSLVLISMCGWLFVFCSTFLIDHFELFGLKQAYYHMMNIEPIKSNFKTPGFYKFVRHPIYLGFTVAFWSTPIMTSAHLLFAIATLGYVIIGIFFEEKDLRSFFGDEYKEYQSKVSMLFPISFLNNKEKETSRIDD
ncbi:MAG: methanethiol S-methyltransferase [Cellvibrionaceae bacterium]